jgi:glycosyltransferase involved in cell wall biosynthesis
LGRSAGGIARHVAQITEALDGQNGLAIDIACPPGLPIAMPGKTMDLEIPDGPTGGHIAAIRRLREMQEAGSYDVVHAHGLRAGIDSGLAHRGRARRLVTVHNLIHPAIAGPKAIIYSRAEPLVVRLSDRALAVSAEIARRLGHGKLALERKVEVLYLGVGEAPAVTRGTDQIRAELQVGESRSLIVSVSRLAPQKALHVMLDAIARAPEMVLALLGEGPLEQELRAQAGKLGVSDRVHFLGFRPDVADYVAAADIFCLSSVWEGVPLAAQEAILLGTPVVATRVGGMPELIEDGVSGLLVSPGDADGLAAALRKVAGDHALREQLARSARERLHTTFSTERMLARLNDLYRGGPGAV